MMWDNQVSRPAFESILRAFKKKTGIDVKSSWIDQTEYKALLLSHAAEATLPDVVLIPADYLALDKELRFSEIPSEHLNQGVLKNAVESGVFEGRSLGAPVLWGNHLMLFYNRRIVSKPAKSFEEIEAQRYDLAAKDILPLALNFNEMFWVVPFVGAFGGWPIGDQGQLTLNTSGVAQGLQFFLGLPEKGLTDKKCRHDCILERFPKGEFAYAIGGDWMISELESKLGDKLGVAVLPTIQGRAMRPMFSAHVLAFPNNSLNGPKKEQLLAFARYLQSAEAQRAWAQEKVFPVNEKVFKEISVRANDNLRHSLAQMRYARAMPNSRLMAFAWSGMFKGYSAMQKGKSAEEAAALMQSYAEKMAKRDLD